MLLVERGADVQAKSSSGLVAPRQSLRRARHKSLFLKAVTFKSQNAHSDALLTESNPSITLALPVRPQAPFL